MAYYQGDYYRGDYYRGDPFIKGFLEKVGRGFKGAVGGFMRGGPIGAVTGGVSGAFGSTTPAPNPRTVQPRKELAVPYERTQIDLSPFPGSIYTRERFGPNGLETVAAAERIALAGRDPCPKGMHLDKRTRSRCVKNRRMNVANPKALRRAIRRNRGFVKTFRKAAGSVGMVVYAKRSPKMRKGR